MKKIIKIGILIVLLMSIYIGYKLYRQNKADNKFICDCRNSKNASGVLLFELHQDAKFIRSMKIRLNNVEIPLDRTKVYGNKKPFIYRYENRFGNSDTITISIANKQYVICGFKNDTVIVNDKKGLECELRSAKVNNTTQRGNRYKLF